MVQEAFLEAKYGMRLTGTGWGMGVLVLSRRNQRRDWPGLWLGFLFPFTSVR